MAHRRIQALAQVHEDTEAASNALEDKVGYMDKSVD